MRRGVFQRILQHGSGATAYGERGAASITPRQLLQKITLSEEDAKRIIGQVTQQVQTTPFSFLAESGERRIC